MGDKRLLVQEDVFFYELEEMKQMMTGEWNISDTANIRATAAQRKLDYQGWRQAVGGDLLVGDGEAFAAIPGGATGLPGAAGRGSGPVVATAADLAALAATNGGSKAILVRRAGGRRLGGGITGRRGHRPGTGFAARPGCGGRGCAANPGRL